jgi:transposase-like protein
LGVSGCHPSSTLSGHPNPYRGYRFPREVIAHAVRLYPRFTLNYRDVEELLAERGIAVSYETIRRWVAAFGPVYADELRTRRRASAGRDTSMRWRRGSAVVGTWKTTASASASRR